jgi:hypothetical protein
LKFPEASNSPASVPCIFTPRWCSGCESSHSPSLGNLSLMFSIFALAPTALQVNNAPVSRRSAVRTALSALVVAPAAALAADNSGNYGDTSGYAAPPGIPGFQAGPSFGPGYSKDGTRSTAAATVAAPSGGEFAKLLASSKASFETNTGLKMTPDEEKKLEEKLRKKYPGVARSAG